MEFERLEPYLRRELTEKILRSLYNKPDRSIGEIAREINEAKTTVYEHIVKMRKEGIITVEENIRGRRHKCRLSEEVKSLLKPVFYPQTREPLKYLAGVDVVVSAPSVFYMLGFWKKGYAILLPTEKRVYVGIKKEYGNVVPQAHELRSDGLSPNIYEKSDLVYFTQVFNSIKRGLEQLGFATSEIDDLMGQNWMPVVRVVYEPPLRTGLAASSAFSVAMSVAITKFVQLYGGLKWNPINTKKGGLSDTEKEYVYRLALNPEAILRKHFEVAHPFGTRLFVSTFGTPFKGGNVFFRKEYKDGLPIIQSFHFPKNSLPMLIIDSGGEVGPRLSVRKLMEFQAKFPIVDEVCEIISRVAKMGKEGLEKERFEEVGKFMSITHRLLHSIDQTSKKTNDIVSFLENGGAYGARAIGYEKEACVAALCSEEKIEELKSTFRPPAKIVLNNVSLNVPGVRIE